MHVVMFYHSLLSDWNHGNAHFLRGVTSELRARGIQVRIFEPRDAWSLTNLVAEYGEGPIAAFHAAYPDLHSRRYDLGTLDLDEALDGADLVLVHEWNDHELIKQIGDHRGRHGGYHLLFHDTHHRAITDRQSMAGYDLTNYDGVLAFGNVLRNLYLAEGWAARAWTWHEAADIRVFKPLEGEPREGDLTWIGNGGDEERTAELYEFLVGPVQSLGLRARVYGVRYTPAMLTRLREAGIEWSGWIPNFQVPKVFARYAVTVHIPRRPYVQALPGIPTIRPFEAMACGIPLISAPWDDVEGLFTAGEDFLMARDGKEMERHLSTVLNEPAVARELSRHGRQTVLERHTCAHRVDQLLKIYEDLAEGARVSPTIPAATIPLGR